MITKVSQTRQELKKEKDLESLSERIKTVRMLQMAPLLMILKCGGIIHANTLPVAP